MSLLNLFESNIAYSCKLTYENIKDHTVSLGKGTCPDGCFGERASVEFLFHAESGYTWILTECGFFRSLLPCAASAEEASWLLITHPSAKRVYKVTMPHWTLDGYGC